MAARINGLNFKPEKALRRIPAPECQRAGHEPVGQGHVLIALWCRTEEVVPSCVSHHITEHSRLYHVETESTHKKSCTHWYLWFRYCRINLLLSKKNEDAIIACLRTPLSISDMHHLNIFNTLPFYLYLSVGASTVVKHHSTGLSHMNLCTSIFILGTKFRLCHSISGWLFGNDVI